MNTSLTILHLPRRMDRKQNLLHQLAIQGISNYTIIEGIDSKENTKMAICKGHKMIIGLAKQQGFSNAIVAEDDCCFTAKGAWDYFLTQIPVDYDLFCGIIYAGEVNSEGRILNGMSGSHTLLSVNARFFDVVLQLPDDSHIDRALGAMAFQYKYFVCQPAVVYQLGGFSDNLKKQMTYEVYLEGKSLYGQ